MKLYGLIGYPLGHSFSQQYFSEKFHNEGLTDCKFETFPIPDISQFTQLLQEHPLLEGLCVTIPYKEQVLPFITELSEEVKYIGATNSIKLSKGYLTGYNTDITGFEQSFVKQLKSSPTTALVLGSGGASKAVQYVLRKLSIDFLTVTRVSTLQVNNIAYSQVDEKIMSDYKIIINCTPLGMWPKEHTAPDLPYQFLTPAHYLFDLVYKPAKTLFLQKGKAAGATIQNGYEMLLIQAETSWKIWNNL